MLTNKFKVVILGLGGIILISLAVFPWSTPNSNLSDIATKQTILSNTEIVEQVKPATVC